MVAGDCSLRLYQQSTCQPLHSGLLALVLTKCAACGGREVELWLFVKRDEAEAWAEQ